LETPQNVRFARAADGEAHVVRFRMPDEAVTVHDQIRGEVVVQPEELEDFVILKNDGFPTYHFAVVVDDEAMGVTHVVRGQEHLSNTPKHVALQHALGYRTPVYAHLPLIFSQDGSKMSKRDKDKAVRDACKAKGVTAPPIATIDPAAFSAWLADSRSQLPLDALGALAGALGVDLPEIDVTDFREAGYLPEVVCNYVALLGWSPGDDVEKFDTAFLCERLALDRIGKTNAKFDRAMPDDVFAARWRAWCADFAPDILAAAGDSFDVLAAAVRPRSKTLREAARSADFVLLDTNTIAYDDKGAAKWLTKNDGEGLGVLRDIRARLEALPAFDAPALHALVESFANESGLGMGKVAQPLRMALTGAPVSPPIDATLAILGKQTVLERIDRCLAAFSG
jgi:glutamyl/glutaminyl-tRNA synthetase